MEFPYHRLARSAPGYRWWKPIVTGLIALGFFIVLTVLLAVVFVVLAVLSPDIRAEFLSLLRTQFIDNSSPVLLALSLGSVAVILPSIWLARLIMGPRPVGLFSSVAGRFRWRWMSRLILPVVIAYGASYLVTSFLPGGAFPSARVTATTWVVIAVSVILVPVQAAAEEYLFRGYLMQTIGGWLKHPLFAILIPVPLFAIAHQQYDLWGILDVGVFGLAATFLTWRTGGIEASLMAHAVNNTVIFVLGGFQLVDVNNDTGDWTEVLISAITLALYVGLVLVAARRFGLQRVRVIADPLPSQSFVGAVEANPPGATPPGAPSATP